MADRLVKLSLLFYAVAVVLGMLAGPRLSFWQGMTLLPLIVPLGISNLAWYGGIAAAAARQYRAAAACAVISLIATAISAVFAWSSDLDLGLGSAAFVASVLSLVVGATAGLDDEDEDDEADLMV